METITFDNLLLKTAFCCMASDGNIDQREIMLIKSMCEKSELFKNFNFQEEINQLVTKLNTNGKTFIQHYSKQQEQNEYFEDKTIYLQIQAPLYK
jgi:hypothetical protein